MAEESTLEGVIERLRAEGQLTRNSGTNSIKTLIETNTNAFGLMSNRMGELIDFFKGNALQEEENRRELLKALKAGKEKEEKERIEKKETNIFDGIFDGGLSTILAGLTAAVVGLTAGFIVGVGQFFAGLLRPLTNFIKQSKAFQTFQKIAKSIGNTFKSIGNTIKTLVNSFKSFIAQTKLFRTLRVNINLFGKKIRPVVNLFKELGKTFSGITKSLPTQGLGRFFNPIKSFFQAFAKILPTFFKVGRSLGKTFLPLLGKLFLPITVLISLFDFVKGAMAGFEQYSDKGFLEGIIGALGGGIGSLVAGLIGMPLDLLKSAISWIAEKLGFENFSELLDSFSFAELIKGVYDKATETIIGFITNIKESIAEIGFADTIKNIGLGLVKIFKKIASFPMAVAAGASSALAAALPGGQTPMEAFKEGFAKVFNAGDTAIDSFKVPTGGGAGSETGEESLEVKEDDKKTKGFFSRLFSSDKEEAADESFEVAARNTTGTEMELGMSAIADAKSQPAPVIVSGGSSPQSTVVNNTTTTYNGSDHVDESSILTRPMSYGLA